MDTRLQNYAQQLDYLSKRLISPAQQIAQQHSQLKQLQHRLQVSTQRNLQSRKQILMHFKNSLSQLNPDNVLARGYALVQKADGTLVKSEAQLLIGDKISIALTVGKIKAEVTSLK